MSEDKARAQSMRSQGLAAEAIGHVCKQPKIESIAFGASSRGSTYTCGRRTFCSR